MMVPQITALQTEFGMLRKSKKQLGTRWEGAKVWKSIFKENPAVISKKLGR